jgi:ubiquinone/menaquinone biosynthesis C-methylase UbiE
MTTRPTHYRQNPKQAAIDQWTMDPCGPQVTTKPGTRAYFEQLVTGRDEYAPWMADILDYQSTRDLHVLDVGNGQGIDVARYAAAGAIVTGIDLTPRHVELTEAHIAAMGLDATVVQGDAEAMPFADAAFDRVTSNGVLHHTPDMPTALSEIRRVLVPGGEVRIVVYNRASAWFWITLIGRYGLAHGLLFKERGSTEGVASRLVEHTTIGARPLVRFYTPRMLRAMLAEAGFHDVRTDVRHFRPRDQILTRRLRNERAIQWLDTRVGYYVIGYGTNGKATT